MSDNIIDQNLKNVIRICFEMLEIADRGDEFRRDSGCGAVYGSLRDAAYKIRGLANDELSRHIRRVSATARRSDTDKAGNSKTHNKRDAE